MNLKEFKDRVDFLYKTERNPENVKVVITTYEGGTLGGRPYCNIGYLHMGFDWEHNQLRIEPENKLIKWGEGKDV